MWSTGLRWVPLNVYPDYDDHFLRVDHMFFIVIYMFLKYEPESGKKWTNG